MFAMQFVGTMPAMIEIAGLLSLILGSYVDVWWSGSSSVFRSDLCALFGRGTQEK